VKAKSALEISDTLSNMGQQMSSKLEVSIEELADLMSMFLRIFAFIIYHYNLGIWKGLLPVYSSLDYLKEMVWLSVQPRKLRQSLEDLNSTLKQLPSHFRNYEAYSNTKRLLDNCSKVAFF
jgi:dynein heavy chain 1